MILTVTAVVLFILFKVTEHYHRKYERMWDGGHIATFVRTYRRTSEAIPGVLCFGSMLCVWFAVKEIEIAQIIGMMLFAFSAFSLMCLLVMSAIKTLEVIFNFDLHDFRHNLWCVKKSGSDWLRSLKRDTADMLYSYVLVGGIIAMYGVLLWDIATVALALS